MAAALPRFFPDPYQEDKDRLRRSFLPGLLFAGLMWLVFVPAFFLDLDLGEYGLYPRRSYGLLGILTAPLLHADWAHLLSNTFPLILLSPMVFYMFPKKSGRIMLLLYLASGSLAWLMARPGYHIGASGIVYALASFIFFSGMFRHDRNSVMFSMVIFFLYGSMIYGIFPSEGRVSWESHLAGGIAGLFLSFFFRRTELPAPEPKPEIPSYYAFPETITNPPHINASFTGQPQLVIRYTFVPKNPEPEALSDLERPEPEIPWKKEESPER